mmetsp:Transcript_30166/g.58629  ORF Transcript_30166/g.58629 Transcript_30166/m.58629 type:complete len:259 (+) Transcript_30166:152-928(+)
MTISMKSLSSSSLTGTSSVSSLHHIHNISPQHIVHLISRVIQRVHGIIRHATDGMIDIPMFGLIGPHRLHEIQHGSILSKVPIPLGDLGRVLRSPLTQIGSLLGRLYGFDDLGVSAARLLLDVSHKSMAKRRREDVRNEEGSPEDELPADDGRAEDVSRVLHSDEGEQVHPLVIGLFQEHIQHSSVSGHISEGAEVTDDGRDHSGYGGDGFEEDGPVEDFVGGDDSAVPAGEEVEVEAEEFAGVEGGLVDGGFGFHVG